MKFLVAGADGAHQHVVNAAVTMSINTLSCKNKLEIVSTATAAAVVLVRNDTESVGQAHRRFTWVDGNRPNKNVVAVD